MCNVFAHCCVHAGVVGSSVFTTWIIKQNADNLSEITSGMHLSKKITVFFRCFLTEITGMLHVFPVTVQNKFFCKNTLFDFCFRYCYIVYCTVYLYTVHCTLYSICFVLCTQISMCRGERAGQYRLIGNTFPIHIYTLGASQILTIFGQSWALDKATAATRQFGVQERGLVSINQLIGNTFPIHIYTLGAS